MPTTCLRTATGGRGVSKVNDSPDSVARNPGSEDSLDVLVRAAQIRMAYGRLPLALAFTVIVSLLFALLLIDEFPGELLWPGFVLIQLVSGLRAIGWLRYRRHMPQPDEWRRWARAITIGAGAAAAAWSVWVVPALYLSGLDATKANLLMIALVAVSAVAVPSQSPYFPALRIFIALALGPAAIHLFLATEPLAAVSASRWSRPASRSWQPAGGCTLTFAGCWHRVGTGRRARGLGPSAPGRGGGKPGQE